MGGRAGSKNKGRISRFLANKCSIASRIDCFSEVSTKIFGEKLKEQVEDRLKFMNLVTYQKKNVDAMQEAIAAVKEEATAFEEVKNKKKKKDKKKRKAEEMENEENDSKPANGVTNGVHEEEHAEAPKKKKKRVDPDDTPAQNGIDTPVSEKKKKKKDKKNSIEEQPVPETKVETPITEKK